MLKNRQRESTDKDRNAGLFFIEEGTKKAPLLMQFSMAADKDKKSFVTKIFPGLGVASKLGNTERLPAVDPTSDCMIGVRVTDHGFCLLTLYQRPTLVKDSPWTAQLIPLSCPYTVEQMVRAMSVWSSYVTNTLRHKGRAHVPLPVADTYVVTEFTSVPAVQTAPQPSQE